MSDRPEAIAGVGDVDLGGRTALVTGSTSGIGRAAALALGRLGADVIVHGRDREAGRALVAELESVGAGAAFRAADFAALEEVRDLAAAVRERVDRLDVLCHNAGGLFRGRRLTDAGVARTFQVNHLAAYLLTAELLPSLSDRARVVTTASEAHRGVELDLDSVTEPAGSSGFRAYQRSKLANVAFALELARRLDAAGRAVTSNALHPGAIPGSGFSRFLPGPLPALARRLDGLPFVTSVAEGAAAILNLAASPRVREVSGRYFAGQRTREPSAAARDPEAGRRLWTRSAALLDVPEPLAGSDRDRPD